MGNARESQYLNKIIKLQGISGIKNKQRYIAENKEDKNFRQILWYALNPQVTFKVSEASFTGDDGEPDLLDDRITDLLDLCAELSTKKALNNTWVSFVRRFVNKYKGKQREICVQLLSKTLRLGITATNVNKVIPGLIPEWEVQQAYPIDKYPLEPGIEFTLTQKLNGVRATYYKGKLYSRNGAPYEGLDHIIRAFDFDTDKDVVFDGELTLKDKGDLSDNEAFRTSTGIINSENEDKTSICYTIFDAIPTEEFECGESKITYLSRRSYLTAISDFIYNRSNGYVSVLPVLYQGKDQSKIPLLLDQMVREDKEGLMVNLDVPYKRKRHKGILKVKRFYTMDLPIKRCVEGTGRLAGTLGAIVLDYKGNEVNVGTGFTDEERLKLWTQRFELPGVLCEVKYKEISSDKTTGEESLQFPVFVSLRIDKSSVSYG